MASSIEFDDQGNRHTAYVSANRPRQERRPAWLELSMQVQDKGDHS